MDRMGMDGHVSPNFKMGICSRNIDGPDDPGHVWYFLNEISQPFSAHSAYSPRKQTSASQHPSSKPTFRGVGSFQQNSSGRWMEVSENGGAPKSIHFSNNGVLVTKIMRRCSFSTEIFGFGDPPWQGETTISQHERWTVNGFGDLSRRLRSPLGIAKCLRCLRCFKFMCLGVVYFLNPFWAVNMDNYRLWYIYIYNYDITTPFRLLFRGDYQNVRYIFWDPPLM